uniref:Ankyrin repeat domain-containing protein n=1 Tax=Kalanchoe fedtschenkoi TaxID=63787 RepID=A0A7N0UII3_KALFE
MSQSMAKPASSSPAQLIRAEDYAHSPVHLAVVLGDSAKLSRILSSLPRLADPTRIHTEADSLLQERIAEQISAVVDRRDVPFRETPLHLAVRLNDGFAARKLAEAGADISLQSAAGWNALQEALCRRSSDIALLLVKLHHRSAWAKWRRRQPRLVAALKRMRDFYMEISFHFESSVIPFVGKIAPSDTYKIWKREGNLRADTSLAGFDGLKIQRADQSFLFLGDGDAERGIAPGSFLVVNRDEKKIFDAFENAGGQMSDADVAGFCKQTSVYRPGMDVTKADLVCRTNWRRQEKVESVGEWKARVYEIHNVVFSFRTRKVIDSDVAGSEQVLPLELDEDDDGFLVAENPEFLNLNPDLRRHSSFVREEKEWFTAGRKSVDFIPSSVSSASNDRRRAKQLAAPLPQLMKEKEYVKNFKPSVWLTEQFPLKTEELLPLLDILANKVKAVRRMRELLTTKFPPGTFPVKLAIPVVPTVRIVITFTKFVELQPVEKFYTPLSSPRHLVHKGFSDEDEKQVDSTYYTLPSSSSSVLRSSVSSSSTSTWSRHSANFKQPPAGSSQDPFAIPSGYSWTSIDDRGRKMEKSKSVRRPK